ncbi:MAG: thiopurine S-methyltransferase [Planctomycetota bacterium]
MNNDFWLARWREGQIGFHNEAVNPLLASHWPNLGIAPHSKVLVPFCGKSLDLVALAGWGHDVHGIEISPLAREAFFAENRLSVSRSPEYAHPAWTAGSITFHEHDLFKLSTKTLGSFDAFYDRAACIALPEPQRPKYLRHLSTFLKPGGIWLLITLTYDQTKRSGPPFSVDPSEITEALPGFSIHKLASADVIGEKPKYREEGLTSLVETVWVLRKL